MNLKIPKIPHIAKTWNASGPKPGLGPENHMMKKFLMYHNMFGNGFGALPGAPMPGGNPGNNIGGIQSFAAGRKMGII